MSVPAAVPEPSFRQLVYAAAVDLAARASADLPAEAHVDPPLAVDDVTIRCQRVWRGVRTLNPVLDGGDIAAGIGQFARDGGYYSFFITAIRPAGESTWHVSGMSGGRRPAELLDRAGGFLIASGSHVCVGGLGAVPDGGAIRVELTDGSAYEDRAHDGCAIAFAPVTTPPGRDDRATVRYLDPSGAELGSDTVWIGVGGPPSRQ